MRALPTEQTTECISFHRVHQNLNTLCFNICNPTTGCLCLCSVMEKCQFAPSITAKYLQDPLCVATVGLLWQQQTHYLFYLLHSSSIISLYQPSRFSQLAPKPDRDHDFAAPEQDQHGHLPVKTPRRGGKERTNKQKNGISGKRQKIQCPYLALHQKGYV